MAYRELLPPPSIRRHVACLWVHVAEHARTHAVVPDACADVIIVGRAPRGDGAAIEVVDSPVIVGPATRTEEVQLAAGTVIVGARMRPGSVATAFGLDASELLDRDAPLADVWGRSLASELVDPRPRRDARSHLDARHGDPRSHIDARHGDPRSHLDARHGDGRRLVDASVAAQLAALERVLVARLADRAHDDPVAVAAVAWIARHPGAHVAALARELGFSARQLQRRIRTATGYAPKLLHRILRFQRALVALGAPSTTLAGVAADAGYLDQAHLTREVRAFAAATPRALQARALDTTSMSEFFKTVDDATPIVAA